MAAVLSVEEGVWKLMVWCLGAWTGLFRKQCGDGRCFVVFFCPFDSWDCFCPLVMKGIIESSTVTQPSLLGATATPLLVGERTSTTCKSSTIHIGTHRMERAVGVVDKIMNIACMTMMMMMMMGINGTVARRPLRSFQSTVLKRAAFISSSHQRHCIFTRSHQRHISFSYTSLSALSDDRARTIDQASATSTPSHRIPKNLSLSTQHRINDLIHHPAIVWDTNTTFASMQKKKLGRRHLPMFDRGEGSTNDNSMHDALFDEFAIAVCNAGVVARKEVFETWATALYIHDSFLKNKNNQQQEEEQCIRRVADIAAGHGLLAWSLLILDDEQRRNQQTTTNDEVTYQPLTAFCLDVHMPPSAERVQKAMLETWPHLEKQFDYVEGRLEQLVPHRSCLLAGVHACGTLSDVLVATAAECAVPLALVPCCHSRKRKVLEACASPFARREYELIYNTKGTITDLVDRLDEARMVALENSGMDVDELFIPEIFTGKNRLIMGYPPLTRSEYPRVAEADDQSKQEVVVWKGQMPPLKVRDTVPARSTAMINPRARFMKGFYVPCEDSHDNRAFVAKISGRAEANNRKVIMHNRHHIEMPQFDLSLWLPPGEMNLSKEAISSLVESKYPNIKCNVSILDDYTDSKSGRRAQTFRIQYKNVISVGSDETIRNKFISFVDANKVHKELYDEIPIVFIGAKCR